MAVGIAMFLVLTVAGYLAVRWIAGPQTDSIAVALVRADRSLLLLAAVLVAVELTLGGARFWVLARRLAPGFGLRDGVKTNLYMLFGAGVTPMQVGAAPAQYFILRHKGIHAHDTLAILGVNWLGGLVALVVLGGAGLWYLILDGDVAVHGLLKGLIIMVGVTALAALAVVFFPKPLTRLLIGIRPLRRGRVGKRILRTISRYRSSLKEFKDTARGREAWLLNLGVSLAALFVRCLVGAVLLAALGVSADVLEVVARQALQFAVMTVAPTPGGSGVAEITTVGLMAGLVPSALLVSYTILWRIFTGYAGIAAGTVVVVKDLFGSAAGRDSPESEFAE